MAGRLKPGDEMETEIRPINLLRRRDSGSFQKCQRETAHFICSGYSELMCICIGPGFSPRFILSTRQKVILPRFGACWNVFRLFLIVLIHEFGHQLACRSVGGKTSVIVLWPLGGVAYVAPPQRPGAQLWSIAAGPLVNVILFPILYALLWLGAQARLVLTAHPTGSDFINNVWYHQLGFADFQHDADLSARRRTNFAVAALVCIRASPQFDDCQQHRLCRRCRVDCAGLSGQQSVWLGIMAAFILMNCWGGLMQARAMVKMANAPRREGFACPVCKTVSATGLPSGTAANAGKPSTFLKHRAFAPIARLNMPRPPARNAATCGPSANG